jgi:hypothetical protein
MNSDGGSGYYYNYSPEEHKLLSGGRGGLKPDTAWLEITSDYNEPTGTCRTQA